MSRFVLIGCSKSKRHSDSLMTPQEMYLGALFRKRVEYAESRRLPWLVLSAHHGLWVPGIRRKSYDKTLADMRPIDVAAWHVGVASQLMDYLDYDEYPCTVEIHAGRRYCEPLATILEAIGIRVLLPAAGLGIGRQLQAYTSGILSK